MKIVTALLSTSMLFSVCGVANAGLKAKCSPFFSSARVQLFEPVPGRDPIGVGVTDYLIGEESSQAEVSVFLLGEMLEQADGTVLMPIELLHDFLDGDSLSWFGNAVLTQTSIPGVFTLDELVSVINSTGRFEGIMGRGEGYGEVSFVDFEATINAEGFLCAMKEKSKE